METSGGRIPDCEACGHAFHGLTCEVIRHTFIKSIEVREKCNCPSQFVDKYFAPVLEEGNRNTPRKGVW